MSPIVRFADQPRFVLPGSRKEALNESTRVSPPSGLSTPEVMALRAAAPVGAAKKARGIFSVAVIVRRKKPLQMASLGKRTDRMTHATYVRDHGPDVDSMAAVTAFAKEYGLRSKRPTSGRRAMELTGTVAAMQKAFGVSLNSTQIGSRTYRTRQGDILLPRGLYGHVEAVLGLDNRPQAEPHFRVGAPLPPAAVFAEAAVAVASGSFSPAEVAKLYQFPSVANARSQTIALLEFGGGYDPADLKTFFTSLGQPVPKIVFVSADGTKNSPTGDPMGPDCEVLLDIEIAGSAAPGATLVLYFAQNTSKGFLDAVATAVHDVKNKPTVMSISWGAAEIKWTPQTMTVLDEACQAAAALGITIMAAAGDHGSADAVEDNSNHVDFPASSPYVLSCGGTKLTANENSISKEVVWNEELNGATGGGVSNFFPVPQWQKNSNVPKPDVATGGRGVPDVCGNAAQHSGYNIVVDGQNLPVGGTSAVAPLWAALIALSNWQNGSSAGFINPQLYASDRKSLFRDITSGNNGAFSARRGWDACTGLGSPIGMAICQKLAVAGAKATTRLTRKPRAVKRAIR